MKYSVVICVEVSILIEMSALMVLYEIAMEFLIYLDARSLQNAFRINRLYASISYNDMFWRRKIKIDYPDLNLSTSPRYT